jgi:hypothetical protein
MKHTHLSDLDTQKQELIGFIKRSNPFYQFVDFHLYDITQLSMIIQQWRNNNTSSAAY